jgi:hypothetical protein
MEGTQEGIFRVNPTNPKNDTGQDGLLKAVTGGVLFINPLFVVTIQEEHEQIQQHEHMTAVSQFKAVTALRY